MHSFGFETLQSGLPRTVPAFGVAASLSPFGGLPLLPPSSPSPFDSSGAAKSLVAEVSEQAASAHARAAETKRLRRKKGLLIKEDRLEIVRRSVPTSRTFTRRARIFGSCGARQVF